MGMFCDHEQKIARSAIKQSTAEAIDALVRIFDEMLQIMSKISCEEAWPVIVTSFLILDARIWLADNESFVSAVWNVKYFQKDTSSKSEDGTTASTHCSSGNFKSNESRHPCTWGLNTWSKAERHLRDILRNWLSTDSDEDCLGNLGLTILSSAPGDPVDVVGHWFLSQWEYNWQT